MMGRLAAVVAAAVLLPNCDSTASTPTPAPSSNAWSCTVTGPDTGCPDKPGPNGETAYVYPRLPASNGYTTYINNDCWADPQCQQTLEANDPGDWQVTAREPAGNTSVKTFPDVQQLTNTWCPTDPGFESESCSVPVTDMPISGLATLTSTYAESTPRDAGVIAQFAWDVWTSNGDQEIMVWVDNQNRPPAEAGATIIDTAKIGGQSWSLFRYGSGDGFLIWSLGTPDAPAQQTSGMVDLLALLTDLQARDLVAADAKISQINAGWEICSTGGQDRTFRLTDYAIDAVPA